MRRDEKLRRLQWAHQTAADLIAAAFVGNAHALSRINEPVRKVLRRIAEEHRLAAEGCNTERLRAARRGEE